MNKPTLLLSLLFALASSALAHGDQPHGKPGAKHDAPKTPAPAPPAGEHGAHKKDEHPQPHGGQVFVLDAADHTHAEVVFHDGGVRLWLYDQDMKPLTPPPDAKATLVVGKEVRKLDLKRTERIEGAAADAAADPHLAVATPLPKDGKVALVVQATVGGKLRSGRVERAVVVAAPAPNTP